MTRIITNKNKQGLVFGLLYHPSNHKQKALLLMCISICIFCLIFYISNFKLQVALEDPKRFRIELTFSRGADLSPLEVMISGLFGFPDKKSRRGVSTLHLSI